MTKKDDAAKAAANKADMERRIRAKVSCDKAAYSIQWRLLEGAVDEGTLSVAAQILQPHHYDDVETERALDGQCGNPRCAGKLPKPDGRSRGHYHFSVADKRVYDSEGLRRFCGIECARTSREYAAGLSVTALHLREGEAAVQRLRDSLDALGGDGGGGGVCGGGGNAGGASAAGGGGALAPIRIVERDAASLAPSIPPSSVVGAADGAASAVAIDGHVSAAAGARRGEGRDHERSHAR